MPGSSAVACTVNARVVSRMQNLLLDRAEPAPSAPPPPAVSFRASPYVCGALGRFDEGRLDRLKERSPTSVHEVHRSTTAVLLASAEPERWQSGDHLGLFWNALAADEKPTSWRAAAERRMAAGMQVATDATTLHTDALGVQDLYTRRIGGAIYFSVRIDPLLRLDDTQLHTDWTAWASILALTAPTSDTTPFLEVRRMTAATAWVADHHGISTTGFEPAWLSAEPDGTITPGDAVAAIEQQVPTEGGLAITLSGGFDSRLLAVLGARRHDRVVTWTTSVDDGRDRDLGMARPVADALGIEHRIVMPGPDAWLDELTSVRQRLDFQTTHHVWFMPLARTLHEQPELCMDGLMGDTLFRAGHFIYEQRADANLVGTRQALWARLSQKKMEDPAQFAPGVAADFEERSRASFAEVFSRFDGHPAAQTLGSLHTRGARAIAMNPLRLLAPEGRVIMPFIHPDVIDAALRVSVADKMDGAFYREMLLAADSQVAQLPSTNDGGPKGRRGPRRQSSPKTLQAMASTISASDMVVGLLGPDLRQALGDSDALDRVGGSVLGHRLLNWASLLAEWHTTYDDLLADDELFS